MGENTIRRSCIICGTTFTIRTGTQKACSPDCSRRLRLGALKEIQRRGYVTRSLRPDIACEACGEMTPQARTGPPRRWCGRCRATQEDDRARRRQRGIDRPCYKCGINVPERAGKPGRTVCTDCRAERVRPGRVAYERRRRLRRYGLTEEEYVRLLAVQDGRCAICATTRPGAKGWCVDHDHVTGQVRGLLCMSCNAAIGLLRDDPEIIEAAASYVRKNRQMKLVIA